MQPKKRKCKILIDFDDMIANMLSNKNIATELITRGRKPDISLAFIIQSYSDLTKILR